MGCRKSPVGPGSSAIGLEQMHNPGVETCVKEKSQVRKQGLGLRVHRTGGSGLTEMTLHTVSNDKAPLGQRSDRSEAGKGS